MMYCTAEYQRMWLCQDEEEWAGYLGIKTSPGPGCWLSISKINWPPCNMKYSQERSWLPHLLQYYIAIAKVSTICTWRVEVRCTKSGWWWWQVPSPSQLLPAEHAFNWRGETTHQLASEETVSQSALQYFQTWHWRNFLWRDEWTVVSIFKPDTSSPALCV